jgi:hypothetical protein
MKLAFKYLYANSYVDPYWEMRTGQHNKIRQQIQVLVVIF